jgi:hypothetical protein
MHVHGFGLSGRYLLPTAALLVNELHTPVPDLPGFGRSGNPPQLLDVSHLAHAAARLLDDRGWSRRPWSATRSAARRFASVPTPTPIGSTGRSWSRRLVARRTRQLPRAVKQLAHEGIREPVKILTVAAPDYLRFGVPSMMRRFRAPTQFPALDRLLAMPIPTLAVLGSRDG